MKQVQSQNRKRKAKIMQVMQQQILKDMVSESYMVNQSSIIADDQEQCVSNAKMQKSGQMKRIDRYMLQITNEMVSDKSENKK